MKHTYTKLAFAAIAVASLTFAGVSAADGASGPSKFKTKLDSYEETPTLSTPGGGTFNAKISKAGDAIDWSLTFGSLTSDATQSHLHLGARATAGGVFTFLCSNLGNGPAGTQACPAAGGTISGTIHAADIVPVASQGLAAGDLAAAIKAMRAGVVYVNVHSTNFPGGEVRGPIGKRK